MLEQMSRSDFYHYLFANDILFKLDSEHISHEQEEGESREIPAEASVGASDEQPKQTARSPESFPPLRTRLAIVVNTYGKGIKSEEREFLAKVMKAVKYDLEDVDLLELDQLTSRDASAVLERRLADYLLLFGVKPEMLNLNVDLDLYKPINHHGVWLLMSNSLLRIEMEESKRRDLWMALKTMFLH